MRWRRRAAIAGLLVAGVFLPDLTPVTAAGSEMSAQVRDVVATTLGPALTPDHPGGVALVIYVAGHVEFSNYGLADHAAKRPVTSDSLFNLASMRKLFEATLVALGALRGELSLDDPVAKYVPELHGDYVSRVTIGELASHTSGLSLATDHPPWPSGSYSLAQFIDLLNAWTPSAGEQPGKQRVYTHAGYVLLQLALERRYGVPIRELIEGRILKPLGMNATLLPDRGPDGRAVMSPQFTQRAVQGYSDDGTPIGVPGDQQGYYDFEGTGQMFSSARDLSILLAACLDGKATEPQLREALQTTLRERFRADAQFGQAMAWETVDVDGLAVVDKPAGLNNASAYMGVVPARNVGVLVLANRAHFPTEIARFRILPALSRL